MSECEANHSDATCNDTLDDASGSADNSIIGKVKSRVSSIFPNSLYKWFSPSVKPNDSMNGSLGAGIDTSSQTRRRRRLEVEEEEEDDDDDDDEDAEEEEEDDIGDEEQQIGEYDENTLRQQRHHNHNTDEESNNSEEDNSAIGTTSIRPINNMTSRRGLNTTGMREPPTKRSRFALDVTNTRSSPLMPRQPLVSSTPAVSNNLRGRMSLPLEAGHHINRYTHLNLYNNQASSKEPAYNFGAGTAVTKETVPVPNYESSPPSVSITTTISSRRSLHLPPSTTVTRERYSGMTTHMKHQMLSSVLGGDTPQASTSAGIMHERTGLPQHTSTTVVEVEEEDDDEEVRSQAPEDEDELAVTSRLPIQTELTTYNGSSRFLLNKRQKLLNGSDRGKNQAVVNSENLADSSVSESSEGATADGVAEDDAMAAVNVQRKTGLFNMSAHSGHGSRTSSFGNGLNFYSHLEGRKSLFSGAQVGVGGAASVINNSTLSLTSLNRRQFNASIYGSTSALSDSRLLNTFSPFYKGRTTYGGAAAYNKYTAAGTGAGASAVRITPTLMRPTSSLSTLSSSNNSLAAGSNNAAMGTGGAVENSALSSTAKRILDLINDFATPLSEAKKMASNLKLNQQQQVLLPQSKSRLNDSYLEQARAMRLSQVRTPYMRPMVTLQPNTPSGTHVNGQSKTQMPPVRELQVPSMSQLLQLRKMQSVTERFRQIAKQTNANKVQGDAEYTLPITVSEDSGSGSAGDGKQQEQQTHKQRHTNKMKHKVTTKARTTSSLKDAEDDTPPPPVNLPNIAFPLMQSVPKIDIALPTSIGVNLKPVSAPAATLTNTTSKSSVISLPTNTGVKAFGEFEGDKTTAGAPQPYTMSSVGSSTIAASNTTASTALERAAPAVALQTNSTSTSGNDFVFAAPLELRNLSTPIRNVAPISGNYKFSPPTLVNSVEIPPSTTKLPIAPTSTGTAKQLKSGSVLDALKKPFSLSTTTTTAAATTATVSITSSFGSQFKKATDEWECDSCMLRNKKDSAKCVACETPRKSMASSGISTINSITSTATGTSTSLTTSSTFGSQFKKAVGEWECDACMVRNKSEAVKCVACETLRKGSPAVVAATSSLPAPLSSVAPTVKQSFGDAFKPKANSWECSTCLVQNKGTANVCIACETKRAVTSSSTATPSFNSKAVLPSSALQLTCSAPLTGTTDTGFQALAAAQKTAKWECEACMTRNDAARVKCVCCEQPKPGSHAVGDGAPKFSFGATAASKFSFGFATSAASTTTAGINTSITTAPQKTDAPTQSGFIFGKSTTTAPAAAAAATSSGFTFGFKPATTTTPTAATTATPGAASTATASKDVADNKEGTVVTDGFKFGASGTGSGQNTATLPTFGFGVSTTSNTTTTTTKSVESSSSTASITSSTSSASATSASSSSPSVKFSLSSTATTNETPNSDAKKTTVTSTSSGFTFSSPKTTATTSGFSFGTPAKPAGDNSKPAGSALGGFAFKAPTSTQMPTPTLTTSATLSNTSVSTTTAKTFSFGAPATTVSTATGTTTATPAAAVKPMFSFGAAATTANNAVNNSNNKSGNGFSFGAGVGAAPKTKSPFDVAAVSSPPVAPITAQPSSSVATAAPIVSGNVFGSFGNTSVGFGAASTATTAASASVFGSATAMTSSTAPGTNIFGAFGNQNSSSSKPTALAAPLFGSSINTVAPVAAGGGGGAGAGAAGGSGFVFGSTTPATPHTTTSATAVPSASTTSTWPQSKFAFGSATPTPALAPSTVHTNPNTSDVGKSVFGSFGTVPQSTNLQSNAAPMPTASIFGTPAPTFGSAAAGPSTNVFGSSSALIASTPAGGPSSNIFGTSVGGSSTFGTPAAFGSSNPSGASPSPAFGNTATTQTFGGFGGATAATAAPATDGASAPKKSEPAFNFGAAPAQSARGGFNFSAAPTTAKQAFNFGASSQPTFNFTGAATETQATKPFQFGAPPPALAPAPVFSFGAGATAATAAAEATPNAPFQFNAGATPASSNIFAPNPTPGAQSAQQARRKIRAPIRRLTPR